MELCHVFWYEVHQRKLTLIVVEMMIYIGIVLNWQSVLNTHTKLKTLLASKKL
jgi:hypothetical protein